MYEMLSSTIKTICSWLGRPIVIYLLVASSLLLFWLLREWLEPVLIFYLLFLVVLGIACLSWVILKIIGRFCSKRFQETEGEDSFKNTSPPSKRIPAHTYRRPDPLIYSQLYFMFLGFPVTWDNPDIYLELNGSLTTSDNLVAGTKYKIFANIWNGSTNAPAVNLVVRFFYLSFGVGMQRHYIGQTLVDLPVKGAPGLPVTATIDWDTPSTPGHYCLQAELVWVDDANQFNNLGQENISVKQLNSPNATFTFPVRNDHPMTRELRLEADAYALPPQEPCPQSDTDDMDDQERNEKSTRHIRGQFPVPEDWNIDIEPGTKLKLEPDETQMVTVKITAGNEHVKKQPININVFAEDKLVGGVTLYVHS